MNDVETVLAVRLEASLRKFEKKMDRGYKKAEKTSNRIEGRFKQMSRKIDRISSNAGRSLGKIGLGAGAVVAPLALIGVSLRSVVNNGDKLNLVTGRLEAITGSANLAASGTEGLLDIMLETGASIETAGSSFTRFTQAGKALGATQNEVLSLTDTVLKLGRIGGGTTSELQAGAIQLGQALASGQLRGDELRSVMENLPVLAEALANALGVGIGELREMAEVGELTSRRVFDALLSKADETSQKFSNLPLTVEIASGRMAAAWTRFTAKIDDSIGLSRTLAAILDDIAAKFDRASLSGLSLVQAQIKEKESVLAAGGPRSARDGAAFPGGSEALRKEIEALKAVEAQYLRNNAAVSHSAKERAATEAKAEADTEFAIAKTNLERERSLALMSRQKRALKTAGDAAVEAFKEQSPGATAEQISNIRAYAEATKQIELNQAKSARSKKEEVSTSEKLERIYVAELEALNERKNLIGKSAKEAARLRAETAARSRLIAAARTEGYDLNAGLIFDIEEYVEKIGEITEKTFEAEKAEEKRAAALKKSKAEADRLAKATDQANAALIDGLVQATAQANSFSDALRNVAIQLVQIAASDFFKGAFGLKGGGSSLGGIFHNLGTSLIGGLTGAPSVPLTGKNALPASFSNGGDVIGPGGPTDDKIEARLSDGEFVVRAKQAKKHRRLLRAINSGRSIAKAQSSVPHFAAGGFVGSSGGGMGAYGDIIINNYSGAKVSAERRTNAAGRSDVLLKMVDEANAANLRNPTSRTRQAMATKPLRR